MNVNVSIDISDVTRKLGEFKSQVPYAASRAINATLKTAQTEQLNKMRQSFTIRRDAYAKRSVKITQFANKQNVSGTIAIAEIGGKGSVFEKFENGGVKKGTGKLAIPSTYIRPSFNQVVSKAKKPRNLKGSFKGTTRTGKPAIFVRKGSGKNTKVELAYFLKPMVKIDKRLQFVAHVTAVANREFKTTLDREITNAIATAKLK